MPQGLISSPGPRTYSRGGFAKAGAGDSLSRGEEAQGSSADVPGRAAALHAPHSPYRWGAREQPKATGIHDGRSNLGQALTSGSQALANSQNVPLPMPLNPDPHPPACLVLGPWSPPLRCANEPTSQRKTPHHGSDHRAGTVVP